MIKKILITLFVILLSCTALVFGQNTQDEQALKTFKPLVSKFTDFFSANPKLISKARFSDSPTGFVYSIREYSFVDVSYNIEKTNSIVSPFIGYFEITVTARQNDSCGNIKIANYVFGWDKIDGALRNDNEKCFSWHKPSIESYIARSEPHSIKFVFAYQDDKWVFKDVIFHNKSFDVILAAFSKQTKEQPPIIESEGLAYNQKWVDLIK